MQLAKSTNGGHWYAYDKENDCFAPRYEVLRADPSKGMRKATLADARKNGWVPSVTSIIGVLDKPAVTQYRISQALMAAMTLPRQREPYEEWRARLKDDGLGLPSFRDAYANPPRFIESDEAYLARVIEDMEAHSEAAKAKGTEIHGCVETILSGKESGVGVIMPDFYAPLHEWIHTNIADIHAIEIIVGDPMGGFAGRLDLDCTLKDVGRCIVDWKSQNVKNGKPNFYPEWGMQLMAYSRGRARELNWRIDPQVLSGVIDSNTGEVYTHLWAGRSELWAHFQRCAELWFWLCGYDPRIV